MADRPPSISPSLKPTKAAFGRRGYLDDLEPCDLNPEPSGVAVVSVTTRLKALGADLANWGARMAASYAVDRLDYLATLSASDAVENIAGAPGRNNRRARLRGDVVHLIIEAKTAGVSLGISDAAYFALLDDDGRRAPLAREIDELADYARPYAESALRFWNDVSPNVVAAEAVCFGEVQTHGGPYQYAGTFDALAYLGGRLRIVDYKTRDKHRLYEKELLQVAAGAGADYYVADHGEGMKRHAYEAYPDGAVVTFTPESYQVHLIDHLESGVSFELFSAVTDIHERKGKSAGGILSTITGTIDDPHPAGGELEQPADDGYADVARVDWLRGRLEALIAERPASLDALVAGWPRSIPTLREAREVDYRYTDAELDQAVDHVNATETAYQASFYPPYVPAAATPRSVEEPAEPAAKPLLDRGAVPEGYEVGGEELEALKSAVDAQAPAVLELVGVLASSADELGVPWRLGGTGRQTRRRYDSVRAAVKLSLAADADADSARMIVDAIVPEAHRHPVPTGAVIGQMTAEELESLRNLADLVREGAELVYGDDGRPTYELVPVPA